MFARGMASSSEKRTVVETYFGEIEALEANSELSPFSAVYSQPAIDKLLRAVPVNWEPTFVQRLYREAVKKRGVRVELRAVKPVHYPALVSAFEQIGNALGTDEAGLLLAIHFHLLWECDKPGEVDQKRFLRNLEPILAAARFTSIPYMARKPANFTPFAADDNLVAIARRVLARCTAAEHGFGADLQCYWSLVFLQLLNQGDEAQVFLEGFLDNQPWAGMRQRIFLTYVLLSANDKDPFMAAWRERLRETYPSEWLEHWVSG